MHTSTSLIHHAYLAPEGFAAPQIGVHKASTVIFPCVAALRARDWQQKAGYTYGLHGTPTSFVLEERIATLEHAKYCVLAPSGLAAVALPSLALVNAGQQVLLPTNSYGPNTVLAQTDLARWGIGHAFYDPMQPQSLAHAITSSTALVWLEVPGSVSMEFAKPRA
jgi:cysteine-S-conjugate beta-lyase